MLRNADRFLPNTGRSFPNRSRNGPDEKVGLLNDRASSQVPLRVWEPSTVGCLPSIGGNFPWPPNFIGSDGSHKPPVLPNITNRRKDYGLESCLSEEF